MGPSGTEPQPQEGIWTEASSTKFYQAILALSQKLQSKSPESPKDYRSTLCNRTDESAYALSYEEELHLADHFAFLAHAVPDDPAYVSAVALEQDLNCPSLVVRLASNKSPKASVIKGLTKIFSIVKEHAEAGRDRTIYQSRLFTEVVKLSQMRIYRRLRTSQSKGSSHISVKAPVHAKVAENLTGIWSQTPQSLPDITNLRTDLLSLNTALVAVDSGSSDNQIELLKAAILKSHMVGNRGESKSLAARLEHLGFNKSKCQRREVQEIDKLSKYWQICIDLIRLSRQPQTRPLCKNLTLEVCVAPPRTMPIGSTERCSVHGEVQLILFYERYPKAPPPRAIGSSKAACLLCDLFVGYHGRYGLSHSHMKPYSRWTIPECRWATDSQREGLRGIVDAMTTKLRSYQQKGQQAFYHHVPFAESRAHVLLLQQASMVSSDPTLRPPPASRLVTPCISIQHDSSSNISSACLLESADSPRARHTTHRFRALPVALQIHAWTRSCTLTAGDVEFFIDLSDVWVGALRISAHDCRDAEGGDHIDLHALGFREEKCVRVGETPGAVQFGLHSSRAGCVRVVMSWEPLAATLGSAALSHDERHGV